MALAGFSESGKTSLLARLHQQFQRGPIGGFSFHQSRTLFRFEEMNWKSTVASGRKNPAMDHSSRAFNNSFLHLTVRNKDAIPVDLLINDISGETFKDAVAVEGFCDELLCVRRADHVAILVDGEAICKPDFDQIAKSRNIAQRFLQTKQIGKHTVLHLIITKLDRLKTGEASKENLERAGRLVADFKERFSSSVAEFRDWYLAARPTDGSMPTEETISNLFINWLNPTLYTQASLPLAQTTAHRDFCRFNVA